MLRFLGGLVFGVAMALGYVHLGWELPGYLQLPDKFKGNVISSTVEDALLDMSATSATRRRALEVLFDNRAAYAAQIDVEMGHPFLDAYQRRHAAVAARRLRLAWAALDEVLAKPALRAALEKKHGTTDTLALKRAELVARLEANPFLKAWMQKENLSVAPQALLDSLSKAGRMK